MSGTTTPRAKTSGNPNCSKAKQRFVCDAVFRLGQYYLLEQVSIGPAGFVLHGTFARCLCENGTCGRVLVGVEGETGIASTHWRGMSVLPPRIRLAGRILTPCGRGNLHVDESQHEALSFLFGPHQQIERMQPHVVHPLQCPVLLGVHETPDELSILRVFQRRSVRQRVAADRRKKQRSPFGGVRAAKRRCLAGGSQLHLGTRENLVS
mmetsp:Transcript_21087/g.58623  ORF Transcript_21087/g.58623 Transcript_21087/m.58623 type:complete len:208 (+) Transcript_21087:645-1268(+)